MLRKSILCILLLVIASIGSVCFAEEFTSADGDYKFTITNGTAEITGYEGEAAELKIPSRIEHGGKNYSVTSIGFAAFSHGYSLTSVTIPDSVTSIENQAFQYCYYLTSITIPNSVTTIGNWVFVGCSNLISITIPSSVTSIGGGAFAIVSNDPSERFSPNNLTHINVDPNNPVYTQVDGVLFDKQEKKLHTFPGGKKDISYIIPDRTVSIGSRAFRDCNLSSVTIPDSVTSIEERAFVDSNIDSSITIPDSVTFIGEDAFRDCFTPPTYVSRDSYAHRYVEQNAVPYTLIGEEGTTNTVPAGMFKTDGYLFVPTGEDAEIERYDGSDLELNIPSSLTYQGKTYRVTSIGEEAFIGSNLTSVTIPDTVISIGESAFRFCDRLTSVTIPDSVISIGDYAFLECWNLTTLTIPASVISIGERAFYVQHSDILLLVLQDSYAYEYAIEKNLFYSLWPVVEETYRTTDNLRLRQNAGTAGTPLFTLPKGTSVKVLARGNVETIDDITANWVQVEVTEDTESTQGDEIEKGAVGWCFGGYLGEL